MNNNNREYDLWRCWWYAAMWGASPQKRMQILDNKRGAKQ